MFKSLSLIKFRRTVIAVLFVKKLQRTQKPSKSSHPASLTPDFTLIDMLNRGLQTLKQEINRQITQQNIDAILGHPVLFENVIKIFNSKDYYNKKLFDLEQHMDAHVQQEKAQRVVFNQLNQ